MLPADSVASRHLDMGSNLRQDRVRADSERGPAITSSNLDEPDQTLVDGMINANESFLRSSEVHRLLIQELVERTYATVNADPLHSQALRELADSELLTIVDEMRDELLDRVVRRLMDPTDGNFSRARDAVQGSPSEIEDLLRDHVAANAHGDNA